jgi:peptide/nickel transport system permease protein
MRAALIAAAAFALAILAGPSLGGLDYAAQDRDHLWAAPSAAHWLGTDALGRDNFARFLHGGRLSLALSSLAAAAACLIAAVFAALASLTGAPGRVLGSVVFDVMLSVPWYLLVFCLRAWLPLDTSPAATAAVTFAVLGLVGWAHGARTLRDAIAQSARSRWLLQARLAGLAGPRLFFSHILPNLRPLVRTQFLLLVPTLLLGEATLGMLGLGIPEPMPSWGGMLADLTHLTAINERPWLFAPAAALALFVICLRALSGAGQPLIPTRREVTIQ